MTLLSVIIILAGLVVIGVAFYLEKAKMYPAGENFRMTDATLETYIRAYIASQPGEEITFAWQGSEPTLLGLDFFRRVITTPIPTTGSATSTKRK